MPEQDRVEIHLLQRYALVFELGARADGEPFEQRLGLLAPMRFDHADQYLDALFLLLLGGLQHRVGLAHTRAHPEKIFNRPRFAASRSF